MAAFPSYANILRAGFSQQRESALQRTEMESGPPKQTKVRSRVMVRRQMLVQFVTVADYQSFLTWFQTDVAYGADWFDWTDPVDGVTKQARIVAGLESEAPEPAGGGVAQWRVALTLETWSA